MPTMPFHLIYRPAEVSIGQSERIVALLRTDDQTDVDLQLKAAPGSICLLLDAETIDEAERELTDLGFAA